MRYHVFTWFAFRIPHWLWMMIPERTRGWWADEFIRRRWGYVPGEKP